MGKIKKKIEKKMTKRELYTNYFTHWKRLRPGSKVYLGFTTNLGHGNKTGWTAAYYLGKDDHFDESQIDRIYERGWKLTSISSYTDTDNNNNQFTIVVFSEMR